MTEINRPKLNLNALKGNKAITNNLVNQEKKVSINQNTENLTIKKPNISINKIKPTINTQTTILNKIPKIKTNIQKPENNTEIKKREEKKENKTINNQINTDTEKKSENTNLTEKIKETPKLEKTNEIKENTKIKYEANIKNKEEKEQINENGEIFSGYTSDFTEKKEKAVKEAQKFKLPDSPKKIFFAILSSLIILTGLAFIIIFKIDSPITNKLKTNILEILGNKKEKIIKKEIWTTKTIIKNGLKITYQISNNNEYKIDGKILNNSNEFDKNLRNKIEKLKIKKLKKHLQEEKTTK